MSQHIHFISDISKLAQLKYKKRPIIAQFYTEWCPPCKGTRLLLEKQLRQSNGRFSLACINCDQAEQLNIQYQIQGVPTVIAINCDQNLSIFDRIIGYDHQKLKQFMQKVKKQMIQTKKQSK